MTQSAATGGRIGGQIEGLERRLAAAEGGTADLAVLGAIATTLSELREEYRRSPGEMQTHVRRLGALRQRYDGLVCKTAGAIADHYQQLNDEIYRLQQEREQWRLALITAAENAPGHRVQGRACAVEVKATEVLSMPPTGHADRVRIEEVLARAGVWQQVSQLSGPKLQRALTERQVPPDAADAVLQVCNMGLRFTVKCAALGG